MTPSKPDRRVQRTRKHLHEALRALILEKRYDKITVQDIIDRADVGRSTFYAHFLDKEDLLVKGLQMYGMAFNERMKSAEHAANREHVVHSLAFFQHAYENEDLYRAMLNGGGADFLQSTAREHITANIQAHLGNELAGGALNDNTFQVVTHFLAGALMSILMWWLNNGMPMPPAEINAMYQDLALPSIRQLKDAH